MTNTNTCKNRREQIAAFVLGQLEPAAAQQLQEHLRHCEACQSFHSSFSSQEESLQSAFKGLCEELAVKDAALLESLDEQSEKVRDTVPSNTEADLGTSIWRLWLPRIWRWAVAAVLLIAAGYVAGRASAPTSPDIQQLSNSVTPMVAESVLADVERRLTSRAERDYTRLKREIYAQTNNDIGSSMAENLALYEATLDKRLTDLVQLIEATRALDRRRITKALEHIEANRLEDRERFRGSLVTFAAHVNKPIQKKSN